MNPPINFLPWRQQRRTAFLRFWLLMFVAPLLLAVGITLILRLTGSAEARIDAVLLQAEQQLARSLQITKPRLLEQQQLREQRSQRQRQRQFTRDWQSALEALAALLPEHAWLTTISWQQGTLEIKGLTTSITALNALETSLRQDASFHLNQRGATQQDAQGRWQFEYQLTRKVSATPLSASTYCAAATSGVCDGSLHSRSANGSSPASMAICPRVRRLGL